MKRFFGLLALLLVIFMSCQLEQDFTETDMMNEGPEVTDKCLFDPVVGGVWISPLVKFQQAGIEFSTEVLCNTGDHLIGAVSLQITYNPQIVKPNQLIGDNGVESDVFVLPYGGYAVNIIPVSETEEMLFISAFQVFGVVPSSEAFLFNLNWIGQSTGITTVTPNIIDLIAYDPITFENYTPGTPTAYPGIICIFNM